MSLEIREKAEGEILRLKTMTELPLPMLLAFAGIPERTWREWQGRRGLETKHNNNIPRCYYLTPEEEKVILHFCQNNCAVHEQWHIDFSYIKICGSFFYFVSILDGYSRLILNWRLCDTMEGVNAELLVMETKELYREAKNPRLISDKRGQFISSDFKELLIMLEIEHTFTRACHPQSNGKIERFHRTFKTEHTRRSAYVNSADACIRMALWLAYYNSERLHKELTDRSIGRLKPPISQMRSI